MENTQYIEAYTQFRSRLNKFETYGELISYNWLPEKISVPVIGQYLCYVRMLKDSSDELAYTINQFLINIRKLCAWQEIICNYEEQEWLDIMDEFVEPISIICLILPHSIKERFKSFVAQITHQANIINNDSYEDNKNNLPNIYNIKNWETVDKIANSWLSYENLKSNLKLLNNEDYQKSTNNYRNRYHHQGTSQSVERIVDNSEVNYIIKQPELLKLEEIISISKTQHEASLKCYKSYQCLIKEQVETILGITIHFS
jgi:hypothetical protein